MKEKEGWGEFLVAHSSALCHPADICYICMAAGDPWIKRLQEYCHISFNNIIILWGKRCFIPGALQSLACSFPRLSPFFFCLSSPSLLSSLVSVFLSASSHQAVPLYAVMPCNLLFWVILSNRTKCVLGPVWIKLFSRQLFQFFYFFFYLPLQGYLLLRTKSAKDGCLCFNAASCSQTRRALNKHLNPQGQCLGFHWAFIDHVQQLKEALHLSFVI